MSNWILGSRKCTSCIYKCPNEMICTLDGSEVTSTFVCMAHHFKEEELRKERTRQYEC
jgi:hypothetical protein